LVSTNDAWAWLVPVSKLDSPAIVDVAKMDDRKTSLNTSVRRWVDLLRLGAAKQQHLFYKTRIQAFRWKHSLLPQSSPKTERHLLPRPTTLNAPGLKGRLPTRAKASF
jgi:hypothetical protein